MDNIAFGIYQIRNFINHKIYIGSTTSRYGFCRRWTDHRKLLRNNKHHSIKLQRAWNKYGEESFVFEILEECEPEKCIEREQYYLDSLLFADQNDNRFHKLGYNICRIAGSILGFKHSEKTKHKLSVIMKKRFSTKSNHPNYGKILSQETKNKISLKHKNKILSEETKYRMSIAHIGKSIPESTRIRSSISLRGENNPHCKLTKDDVIQIKKLISFGYKGIDIAQKFNLSTSSISDIKCGRTWRHV